MPNWTLAAGDDWLHYKEATAVSCWCLTCKSCRSEAAQYAGADGAVQAWKMHASMVRALEKQQPDKKAGQQQRGRMLYFSFDLYFLLVKGLKTEDKGSENVAAT